MQHDCGPGCKHIHEDDKQLADKLCACSMLTPDVGCKSVCDGERRVNRLADHPPYVADQLFGLHGKLAG